MSSKTKDQTIQKAKVMAEEFGKLKSRDALQRFLSHSRISHELYEIYRQQVDLEKCLSLENFEKCLIDDHEFSFGQEITISYALGFIDAMDNISTDLYRKANARAQKESPSQLFIPGMGD